MIIGSLIILMLSLSILLALGAMVFRFFSYLFHPRAKDGSRKKKREGEVSIDYVPPRQDPGQVKQAAMRKAEDAAEDVEYEEIK